MSLKTEKRNYRIILIQNNKDIGTLGCYVKKDSALKAFKDFIEKNKQEIIFPKRFIHYKKIKEVKYNIVLIKKRESVLEQPSRLPNEYGEYVKHETNLDEWYVYDIHPYEIEETVSVYGYNPLQERKTFIWIYNNIIKPKASNKDTFLTVKLYKNKIVLFDGTKHDMVICKNKSDAIRMYNQFEQYCVKDKVKYIIFYGDFSINKSKSREIISEIMKFTNWNERKVTRYCVRP